jgi:hypothetical protein
MAFLFFIYSCAIVSFLIGRRKVGIVLALANLLLMLAMYIYHVNILPPWEIIL